jgi:hypothetical protein
MLKMQLEEWSRQYLKKLMIGSALVWRAKTEIEKERRILGLIGKEEQPLDLEE